ncbi:MAG: hypothetical protein AB8B97_24080 [Granulosicoccus sp.]
MKKIVVFTLLSLLAGSSFAARLAPPAQIFPGKKSTIPFSASITYQWSNPSNASSFDFMLVDGSLGLVVYREPEVSATICTNGICNFTPPNSFSLSAGDNHTWRVAARYTKGLSRYSTVRFGMSARVFALPETPIAIFPETDTSFEFGIEVEYRWLESNDAETYEFVLSDQQQGAVLTRNTVDASQVCSEGVCRFTPQTITKPPVSDELEWGVAARNSDSVSTFSSMKFSVTEVVPLAPDIPVALMPTAGSEVRACWLLDFQWRESPGAEFYELVVFDNILGTEVHRDNQVSASVCTNGLCNLVPSSGAVNHGSGHVWQISARNSIGAFEFAETIFDAIEP